MLIRGLQLSIMHLLGLAERHTLLCYVSKALTEGMDNMLAFIQRVTHICKLRAFAAASSNPCGKWHCLIYSCLALGPGRLLTLFMFLLCRSK